MFVLDDVSAPFSVERKKSNSSRSLRIVFIYQIPVTSLLSAGIFNCYKSLCNDAHCLNNTAMEPILTFDR